MILSYLVQGGAWEEPVCLLMLFSWNVEQRRSSDFLGYFWLAFTCLLLCRDLTAFHHKRSARANRRRTRSSMKPLLTVAQTRVVLLFLSLWMRLMKLSLKLPTG